MSRCKSWGGSSVFEWLCCVCPQTRLGPGPRQQGRQVQEAGFPPLERSDQRSVGGVAQRRSAQAKRGRPGCLFSRFGFLASAISVKRREASIGNDQPSASRELGTDDHSGSNLSDRWSPAIAPGTDHSADQAACGCRPGSVTPSETIAELEYRQGVEPSNADAALYIFACFALSGSASPGQLHGNLSVISTAEFYRLVTSRALNSQQF
jgi:hypothetical protein